MLPITSILIILIGKQIVRMLLIFVKLVQFQVESREKHLFEKEKVKSQMITCT